MVKRVSGAPLSREKRSFGMIAEALMDEAPLDRDTHLRLIGLWLISLGDVEGSIQSPAERTMIDNDIARALQRKRISAFDGAAIGSLHRSARPNVTNDN